MKRKTLMIRIIFLIVIGFVVFTSYNNDRDDYVPNYEVEIYNTSNIFYAGYLKSGTYYVLAWGDNGCTEYEGTKAIQVIENNHRSVFVTMYQIIT